MCFWISEIFVFQNPVIFFQFVNVVQQQIDPLVKILHPLSSSLVIFLVLVFKIPEVESERKCFPKSSLQLSLKKKKKEKVFRNWGSRPDQRQNKERRKEVFNFVTTKNAKKKPLYKLEHLEALKALQAEFSRKIVCSVQSVA